VSVFKKQGVYWIDYYVNGHRKRERIGPDKRLAENVLRKRKVEIADGKFLEKQRPITSTFDELAAAYLKWISPNDEAGIPARKRSWRSHDLYAIVSYALTSAASASRRLRPHSSANIGTRVAQPFPGASGPCRSRP
jgi:hypothetical protein